MHMTWHNDHDKGCSCTWYDMMIRHAYDMICMCMIWHHDMNNILTLNFSIVKWSFLSLWIGTTPIPYHHHVIYNMIYIQYIFLTHHQPYTWFNISFNHDIWHTSSNINHSLWCYPTYISSSIDIVVVLYSSIIFVNVY